VSVVKNGVRVLDGLTLTVHAGEHTAIVGPNGAGKTSLINLLIHQDRAAANGSGARAVEVLGHSRWNIFELRTQIGIVSSDLHQRFVAGNNQGAIRGEDAVLSGLIGTYGIVRHTEVTAGMRKRCDAALERMGASHLRSKVLSEMSTGEARRVLIARALGTDPKALVLDEPTAGLDLVARRTFLAHVSAVANSGTTIVLVTHRIEDIVGEISRVLLLKNGRITASGNTREMLTSERLTDLFDAAVEVDRVGDRYFAKS